MALESGGCLLTSHYERLCRENYVFEKLVSQVGVTWHVSQQINDK